MQEADVTCASSVECSDSNLSNLVKGNWHHSMCRNTATALGSSINAQEASADNCGGIDRRNIKSVGEKVNTVQSENDELKVSNCDGDKARSSSHLLCKSRDDIESVSISQTYPEAYQQQDSTRLDAVRYALAAEMVNLYHKKVLPINEVDASVSSDDGPTTVPTLPAYNSINNCRSVSTSTGPSMPASRLIQPERTVVSKTKLVSRSPFKLVKAKTLQPVACHHNTFLPPALTSLQVTAHFGNCETDHPGVLQPCSTSTSSGHQTSIPYTSTNTTRIVSCASPRSKIGSMSITVPVSSTENALTITSSSPKVSTTAARPRATVTSYKFVRRKQLASYDSSRQISETNVKKPRAAASVPHHMSTYSPSFLVMNKYKLVRKKRRSLTSSARKIPSDTKNPGVKSDSVTVRPFCQNSSVSVTTPVMSKYKIVRNGVKQRSPLANKTLMQSTSSQRNNKVQTSSKYKLVRSRSNVALHTPQRTNLSPAASTSQASSYANKHATPLLFLNKYKLIRKRALRRSKSGSYKYSASQYHQFSGKRHSSVGMSSSRQKRARTNGSFLTKYALKRTGKAAEAELDINRILGRKVKNLSKNKYKFVSGGASSLRKSSRQTPFPRKSQLKIDRRSSSARRASQNRRRLLSLTGGSVYKLRRKSLLPALNCRLSFKSPSSSVGKTRRYSARHFSASSLSRFTQRKFNWMRWSAADQRKKLAAEAKNYCTYFNRFGRCSRGDKCKYIHDPDKVSVCTRFLRGTCKVTDCLFSHSVAPHKMPTCRYFLQGVCNRDDCPYRHVNVSVDAEVCLDFARGYCHLADSCKKKHVTVCPEFTGTGSCPRGTRCPLRHVVKKRRLLAVSSDPAADTDGVSAITKERRAAEADEDDDVRLPLRNRRLPSYIAINDTPVTASPDAVEKSPAADLLIRPRLAPLSTSHDSSWLLDP